MASSLSRVSVAGRLSLLLCLSVIAGLGGLNHSKLYLLAAAYQPQQVLLSQPVIQYTSYKISGSSPEELRAAMDTHGPVDMLSGKVRDAFTRWRVTWKWPVPEPGEEVRDVSVDLKIDVIVPEWIDKQSASRELQSKWDTFMTHLKHHEQKHVEIIISNYGRVADKLRLALQNDPSISEDELNQVAAKEIQMIRQLDVEYDASTNNGRREGVIFP